MEDLKSTIYKKIKTLEPENAKVLFGYLLSQENIENKDLIDILLESFCQKAKHDLGISSTGLSVNPMLPLSESYRLIENALNRNTSIRPFRNDFVGEQQEQQVNRIGGSSLSLPQTGLVDKMKKLDLVACGSQMSQTQNANSDDSSILASSSSRDFVGEQQEQQVNRSPGTRFFVPQTGLVDKMKNLAQQQNENRKIHLKFRRESSFTKQDAYSHFSKFGTVEKMKLRVIKNKEWIYGFVTFAKAESARIALAHGNHHVIRGSDVFIKPSCHPWIRCIQETLPKKPDENRQTGTDTEQNKASSSQELLKLINLIKFDNGSLIH